MMPPSASRRISAVRTLSGATVRSTVPMPRAEDEIGIRLAHRPDQRRIVRALAARRQDAGPRGGCRAMPGTFRRDGLARRRRSPPPCSRAVSVISVGSSAVVPSGACAAADGVRARRRRASSLSRTPPPPLTCSIDEARHEHAAAEHRRSSMPAGMSACGTMRLDRAVRDDRAAWPSMPALAVEDAGAGEGMTVAHSVSVTLRRLAACRGRGRAARANASTKP